MTPSRAPFVGLPLAALVLGCGSSGESLDVGADEGGPSFVLLGTDAGGQGAFDAYIEQNDVTVKFITLSCSGDCATVRAVTGTGTGSITATPVSGSPKTISGNFDFTPSSGGFCDGTYTATLEP